MFLKFINHFKSVYCSYDRAQEIKFIISCLKGYSKESRIVDYGCGKGRVLAHLSLLGFKRIIGVDINNNNVSKLTSEGYQVFHSTQYPASLAKEADVILLIHLVEHMKPDQILDLISVHLSASKIVIITPLLIKEFFDDPDHVRPYTPNSLRTLLQDKNSQIARNLDEPFTLLSCNHKISPLRVNSYSSNPIRHYLNGFINAFFFFLYIISFKVLSRKTAYMMNFAKGKSL